MSEITGEELDDEGEASTTSGSIPETPHCKKRRAERGICDDELQHAAKHGRTEPAFHGCKKRIHKGLCVVVRAKPLEAVTAYRSNTTYHQEENHEDAFVYEARNRWRMSEDYLSEEESNECDDTSDDWPEVGRSWLATAPPVRKFWSCCGAVVGHAGAEDGCKSFRGVSKLKRREKEEAYSERSEILKRNVEAVSSRVREMQTLQQFPEGLKFCFYLRCLTFDTCAIQ